MSGFTVFLQQLSNGLVLGFLYGLIAIGLSMVYGLLRMINFAHGDVLMVGVFIALPVSWMGAPFPIVLLAGIAAATAVGGLIQWTVYRPLIRSRDVTLLPST